MKKKMMYKHHIIPRHMGGTNDPSNIIELTVRIVTPDNVVIIIIINMAEFCREHGLLSPLMYKVARGTRTHHRGYKCELMGD